MKEGSPQEEEYQLKEIKSSTPHQQFKDRVQKLLSALTEYGLTTGAAALQSLVSDYIDLVSKEENTPMPLLSHAPPHVNDALTKHWNWPAGNYPSSTGSFGIKNEDKQTILLPFLLIDSNKGEKLSLWHQEDNNATPLVIPVAELSALMEQSAIEERKEQIEAEMRVRGMIELEENGDEEGGE